ncbi:hypothetical protein BHE74_00058791 [Ensete ventricosum]|nr:hypothetical protein BHE74_00058791 [Ensete ventricosum]
MLFFLFRDSIFPLVYLPFVRPLFGLFCLYNVLLVYALFSLIYIRPKDLPLELYFLSLIRTCGFVSLVAGSVNELMESKGGKKKSSSSSSSSLHYEAPLGYSIEDVRPHGGIKKFQTAAYSNCVRKPS